MATRWENNVLGFLREEDRLSIPFNPTRPTDPIDGLFGDRKTDNLVATWQSLASTYQIPAMAQFHSFDVESQTTVRAPVDVHNIEKGLIKVKINQSERLRALTRAGVRDDDMFRYVMDDVFNLGEQVITRTKVAKNELLATGKVTIKENGLDVTVDYGVPAAQTGYTLDLSATADIAAQLQTIIDAARDLGITITGMVTSRKNITRMRRNAGLMTAINGNVGAGAIIRSASLLAYLEEEYGITNVITNDLTYASERKAGTGSSAGQIVQTTKRYFPEDKITFFGTVGGIPLGVGLWGDAPEMDVARFMQVMNAEQSPYIAISQWTEHDPAVLWTKASALFMPVLYNPNSLFIATVTAEDIGELEEITVASTAGTAVGDTNIAVSGYTPGSGESYIYKVGDAAPELNFGQVPDWSWTTIVPPADITAATGKKITVASVDSNGRAVAAGSATVTAKAAG